MNPVAAKLHALARVLRNVRDRRRAFPVRVLTYHRVVDIRHDPQLLAVSVRNFTSQMEYLRDNFRMLAFEEDFAALDEPAVVVTFDDGYHDNYANALPILQRLGMPATFFITTGLIGTRREFWWDEVEAICADGAGSGHSYGQWLAELRNLRPEQRKDRLDTLRRSRGYDRPGRDTHRCMSVDELRELSAVPGIGVGAHTVNHPKLSVLDYGMQLGEMRDSRRQLEQWTGAPVRVFAYPYGGRQDFNDDSVAACRDCGFTRAAANYHGQLYPWTDIYRIPRHVVRNWKPGEFRRRMRLFNYL